MGKRDDPVARLVQLIFLFQHMYFMQEVQGKLVQIMSLIENA